MSYTFDNVSLFKNGVRIFPTMGEIHYSRVPRSRWADTLKKMRAGGVDVASCYVIWIHHEEIEGEYDWTGDRDLRAFLQTAKDEGMEILLRIGPWVHAETRNGGFPDWLLKKDFKPRTNDEKYFETVQKWYEKIYEQARDFIQNPIIGVQIENEFGHCGGLYDESGDEHMKKLKKIAEDVGFRTSLYTATGWGGARTGGLLPVMGGYCDAPWDSRTTEIEPSGNYVFTYERNDHNIGSDHGLGYGITFDAKQFPYLTAELGGGLQPCAHRRTIATAKDVAAVALTKMGSGCNLLGYYMYAGGTNPDGKLTTLQESCETGFPNDLPVKNYDFRAPVREFGQVSSSLRELKLLSYFTHDFGESLCSLEAKIPEENPLDPNDTQKLRYSFRTEKSGKSGYLFVNNYIRHHTQKNHKNVVVKTPAGAALPALNVQNGSFFFFPFALSFGGAKVDFAEATPFVLAGGKIFFYSREDETRKSGFFAFSDEKSKEEGKKSFVVLSRADALNSWRAKGKLAVTKSDAYVLETKDGISITGRGKTAEISIFPSEGKSGELGAEWIFSGKTNLNRDSSLNPLEAAVFTRNTEAQAGKIEAKKIENGRYALDLSALRKKIGGNVSDIFVRFDYEGNRVAIYDTRGGKKKLLLDHFFLGKSYPWEIALSRFSADELSELELHIVPLEKDAKIYLESKPEFGTEKTLCTLHSIDWESEWSYNITL